MSPSRMSSAGGSDGGRRVLGVAAVQQRLEEHAVVRGVRDPPGPLKELGGAVGVRRHEHRASG